MKALTVHPLETRVFRKNEDLAQFVIESVPRKLVQEKMILAVTSKIVSLAEGTTIPMTEMNKLDLVKRESDVFLGEIGYGCFLTIKEGLFIASAGIDESNSEHTEYILYPKDPFESAKRLWQALRAEWKIKDLGILLTDSHTSPLRQGVTGICLSYWGFRAVRDMIGSRDLFGRELKMTKMNFADGLSASAVMVMGEGSERRPLAILEGSEVEFSEEIDPLELRMPLEQDLYYPLIKRFQMDAESSPASGKKDPHLK